MTGTPPSGHGLHVAAADLGHAVVLTVVGELDMAHADTLNDAVRDVAGDARPVVLDASGISFMDSTGIRAILRADRDLAEEGRVFAIMNPSFAFQRLMEMVSLADQFPVVASAEPQDVASLTRPER